MRKEKVWGYLMHGDAMEIMGSQVHSPSCDNPQTVKHQRSDCRFDNLMCLEDINRGRW